MTKLFPSPDINLDIDNITNTARRTVQDNC